jgi:UDP-N-acetyl-D-mannosaminuronic acid transferase (WecB/TagA/CpsF family)
MANYDYIGSGCPDGAIFGSASTEKIGFFGATPVVRQTAPAAVGTTAATMTSTAAGYTTTTQANALVTAVNSLRTALVNLGFAA